MIMFGSIYYIMPRIVKWEWPYPRLIKVHFWLVASGVILYFAAMTVGGVFQGLYMNDAARPFMDSVEVTRPYLMARSIGGSMMLLGQIVFIYLFSLMLFRKGAYRVLPPWGNRIPEGRTAEVASR